MAAAWMTFVYGMVVVYTVTEGAPSSSSSSSSSSTSSKSSSGGATPYAGDIGSTGSTGNVGGGSGYAGNGGGSMAHAGDGGGSIAYAGDGGGSMAYAGDAGGGFFFPSFPYQQQPNPYMAFPFDFNAAFQQHLAALAMLQAGYQNPYMFPTGGQGAYVNTNSLGGDGGIASAAAGGGPDDGISLRIGPGDFPTSGGGGSFSSFSSSSSSDVDGQKRHQTAVGVNDNGKIYFKSASSP